MAQRVNVVLVDDIDGSDAQETVRFSIDGVSYEIDLTDLHADELRAALSLYVGHARKVGSRRGKAARSSAETGTSAADIRAWARGNGLEVPERGRVSEQVREAYAAAH